MRTRTSIDGIVEVASDEICQSTSPPADAILRSIYDAVHCKKNGFYAFDGALLVRPLYQCTDLLGIVEWNRMEGWKGEYKIDLSAHLFFAENIFGEQFSLCADGVFHFEPETGRLQKIAEHVEAWADRIQEDPFVELGQGIACAWQKLHGTLKPSQRLGPKQPFVVGGEFAVSNLAASNDAELMSFRAQLANQIADLPDGAVIRIEISD